MKTKNLFLFGTFLLFLMLVPIFVSATTCPSSCTVNTFLKYESNVSANSLTVTQGDLVNLVMVAYAHGEKLSVEELDLGSTLVLQEYEGGIEQTPYTYLYSKVFTLNTGILIPGTYTLKFTATSLSGVTESSTLEITILKKIVVDSTAPIVKITTPTNGATYTTNKTQLVSTITDDHLSQCWYNLGAGDVYFSCVNGTKVIDSISSKQGSNTWKVYAKDDAGNVGSDSVTFTIANPTDTTSPIVKITNPTNGATYSSQKTSLIFNVSEPNLNSCSYSLDGTHFNSVSSPTNGINTVSGITSVSGSNTWTVQCSDNSGNVGSNSVTFTVSIPVVDTTAPVVKITAPTNGATYTTNKTQMVSTITDNDLKNCWYNLGAGNVSFSCANGTNTINSIMSKQGTNTWKVYAQDGTGNVGSDTVTFTVTNPADTTSPIVKISDPVNGATYNYNKTQMVFNVVEDNLKECWYNIGSGNVFFPCTNGTNTVQINSTQGINNWKVYARDYNGNWGTDVVLFTVANPTPGDTTAPVVKITNPTDGGIYTTNQTQMNFTVTEENLAQCWYNLGAGNVSFSCVNGTNTINSIASTQGVNNWEVYAQDVAGNVGSDKITFSVINSPTSPLEITPLIPTEGQIVIGNIVLKAIVNKNSSVTYSLDSAGNVTMTETSSLSFESSSLSLSVGTHTVLFCAKDSTEVDCKLVNFEVKASTSKDKDTCTSCKTNHNGPLNETNPGNNKNYAGNAATNTTIELNPISENSTVFWYNGNIIILSLILLVILIAIMIYFIKRK